MCMLGVQWMSRDHRATRVKAGGNYLNEESTHRRAIQPNHIKFRTCSALAPMRTPHKNESAELTQGGQSIMVSLQSTEICRRLK
jgi:hypothetical protein